MKEGASNCVERHLTIARLPFYGHILKWGISVVFIANALRRAPHASVRTYVYMRRWRVAIVNFHIGLQTDLGYSGEAAK